MDRTLNPQDRTLVFRRDGYKCRYCGNVTPPFHIDHIYPWSKGGETSINNSAVSCQRCNSKKHSTIGMWPKPIGYFDTPVNPEIRFTSLLWSATSMSLFMCTVDVLVNNIEYTGFWLSMLLLSILSGIKAFLSFLKGK